MCVPSGPHCGQNPHCLGERGEEWRGWHPGPGLPHACHQHLSTIQRMDTTDGALAVFGVPSAGRGESRRAQDGAGVDGARPYPLLAATSPGPSEDLQDLLWSSESCGDWKGLGRPSQASATSEGSSLVPRDLVPLEPSSGHSPRRGQAHCQVV